MSFTDKYRQLYQLCNTYRDCIPLEELAAYYGRDRRTMANAIRAGHCPYAWPAQENGRYIISPGALWIWETKGLINPEVYENPEYEPCSPLETSQKGG